MNVAAFPPGAGDVPVSRFAGTLIDILDRVEYSRVDLDVADNAVYRLRYDAYRREESVPFNDAGIVTDDLDSTPNAMCFGVHIDGELVSSIRLHYLTAEHPFSPSMKVAPDVLSPLLAEGKRFIDPSRFTANLEASLAYPALPFLTLRMAVMATDYYEADYCLALVRREHAAFYRRVFGAQEMSDTRAYPGLAFPVVLYGSDANRNRPYIYGRFPFFRSTEEEREKLFSEAEEDDQLVPASSREAFERAMTRPVAAE